KQYEIQLSAETLSELSKSSRKRQKIDSTTTTTNTQSSPPTFRRRRFDQGPEEPVPPTPKKEQHEESDSTLSLEQQLEKLVKLKQKAVETEDFLKAHEIKLK